MNPPTAAPAIDPADLWDRALAASKLRQESTTISTPPTRGLLRLRVETAPQRLARCDIRRELVEIPDDVRGILRDLVAGKRPWPLYLYGKAGTGKTSAALVMLDHTRAAGSATVTPDIADWWAGFVDVRNIVRIKIGLERNPAQWSRSDGTGGPVSWESLLSRFAAAPLAVLDEIGVGVTGSSDFPLQTLLEVLDRRANDPVKPFVVTCNLKPSELAKVYDDRVADRVLCGTVYEFRGNSRRLGEA